MSDGVSEREWLAFMLLTPNKETSKNPLQSE